MNHKNCHLLRILVYFYYNITIRHFYSRSKEITEKREREREKCIYLCRYVYIYTHRHIHTHFDMCTYVDVQRGRESRDSDSCSIVACTRPVEIWSSRRMINLIKGLV